MSAKINLQAVSEKLLRKIWREQIFCSVGLATLDGKNVKIFSPGISNHDGGPDFHGAKIAIDGITFTGDVELHRHLKDWQQHSHQKDPKYNSVILHVVMYGSGTKKTSVTKCKRSIPTLVLEAYLNESTFGLLDNVGSAAADNFQRLKCEPLNFKIPAEVITSWLKKLSVERIEYKIRRFEERLKNLVQTQRIGVTEPAAFYGKIPFEVKPEEMPDFSESFSSRDFLDVHLWEQLLYEFTLEALGFSKNQAPFLKLARNADLKYLKSLNDSSEVDNKSLSIEAVLFGIAGLLPTSASIHDKESKKYTHQLKSIWKKYDREYKNERLNEAEWQFFRLRPENFPTRRLAGAVHIMEHIISKHLFKSFVQIVQSDSLNSKEMLENMFLLLIVEAKGFWLKHYRFETTNSRSLRYLVGKERTREIIINVIIPLLLLYARIFKKSEIRKNSLDIFDCINTPGNNEIVRTIDSQLLRGKATLNTAPLIQGAIQLYKFYCAEKKCADCEIGELVYISS
jgi:hypothetical protein